jgi:hypothetical protein
MADLLPYLCEPLQTFSKPAFRAARLINFDTGKHDIKRQQEGWLVEATHAIPKGRKFNIWIIGYASKRAYRGQGAAQSDPSNLKLSMDRARQAAMIMEAIDPEIYSHISKFDGKGNYAYDAPETDNSGLWRAVEVHIFLDDPPPPPGPVQPDPPCQGGDRYRKLSIATPGGFSASPFPGAVVAGNVVAFRKEEGAPVIHFYLAPGGGGGFSYSGPKLGRILEWIKQLFSGFSASGMSWSSFTATTPFNFGDLDGGKVWFRESSSKCMVKELDFFNDVDTSGKDLQFGVAGSVVGGPLIRAQ